MAAPAAFAGFLDEEEIKRLNPEQQEFMMRYGHWMDEMTELAKKDKADPENIENQKQKLILAEKAHEMKPELSAFMKDETFALIYRASIERLTKAIWCQMPDVQLSNCVCLFFDDSIIRQLDN